MNKNNVSFLLFIISFYVFTLVRYSASCVLPGHDPLLAPAIAESISRSGKIFFDYFGPTSFSKEYPPGLSIIISLLYHFASYERVLFIFKHLILLVTTLIPFVWALYLQQIFGFKINKLLVIFSSYLGCFVLNQYFIGNNVEWFVAYAGIPSLVLAGFFMPFVLKLVIRGTNSFKDAFLAIPAVIGLILTHYSAIFMLAGVIGGFMLAYCLLRILPFDYAKSSQITCFDNKYRFVSNLSFITICSLIAFVPVIVNVLAESHANINEGSYSAVAFGSSIAFVDLLRSTINFGMWNQSKLHIYFSLFFIFVFFAYITFFRNKKNNNYDNLMLLAFLIGTFFFATLISLLFGSGLLPIRISPDYISRWLLFITPVIYMGLVLSFVINMGRLKIIFVLLLIIFAIYVKNDDYHSSLKSIEGWPVERHQLAKVSNYFSNMESCKPCYFMVQNSSNPGTQQSYSELKAIDLLSIRSTCTAINGTWGAGPIYKRQPLMTIGNTNPIKSAGEIIKGWHLSQKINIPQSVLKRDKFCISIFVATYMRRNEGEISISLSQGTSVDSRIIDVSSFLDNSMYTLCFKSMYFKLGLASLIIEGINGEIGKSATVWLTNRQPIEGAKINGKSINDGLMLQISSGDKDITINKNFNEFVECEEDSTHDDNLFHDNNYGAPAKIIRMLPKSANIYWIGEKQTYAYYNEYLEKKRVGMLEEFGEVTGRLSKHQKVEFLFAKIHRK